MKVQHQVLRFQARFCMEVPDVPMFRTFGREFQLHVPKCKITAATPFVATPSCQCLLIAQPRVSFCLKAFRCET